MITFHNSHRYLFGCASGALGFFGNPWIWEKPAQWLGWLRPNDFTIITKTLTFDPRPGRLRWWCPWRAVHLINNQSVVNSVALTNKGYRWWLDKYRPLSERKIIVSIMPDTLVQAAVMTEAFNAADIVGLQVNVSCPNVEHGGVDLACDIVQTVVRASRHPVIVKLGYQDDYLEICRRLVTLVSAFELINAVPYQTVFPHNTSPLSRYGYEGSVSGQEIVPFAREALIKYEAMKLWAPCIAGGGIDSLEEVYVRERLGAKAFNFGVVFMRHPSRPNSIINQYKAIIDALAIN